MIKVGVVILNYKVKNLALKCLNSVLASSFKPTHVVMVDNSSGDDIEKELPKSERVEFIQTGQNLGYTGGNNVGIKHLLKYDLDYIWILNPDLTVDKKALEILTNKSEQLGAGISCPKIYFEGSKKLWYAGGIFDKANVLGSHRGVDEQDTGKYDTDQETDYATGAAMFISRQVLEKVGLFEERYFLYYEDSDLSLRAKQADFKVMYIPEAVVFHKNAQSTKLGSPIQDYYITRNRMLLASKFLPFRTRFALLREGVRNIQQPIRRKALLDFLLGRFGQGKI